MERYVKQIYFVFLFLFIFEGCENFLTDEENNLPPDNRHKVTIQQGVWGNVWFWEGNFMPSTDNSSDGKITAVVRDIYIYEATSDSMVEPSGGTFYTKINSKLISVIKSDASGFFQITLSPGKYSFFVKEDSLFYANLWDGEGHIQSAFVNENSITKRQINIDYKAVY